MITLFGALVVLGALFTIVVRSSSPASGGQVRMPALAAYVVLGGSTPIWVPLLLSAVGLGSWPPWQQGFRPFELFTLAMTTVPAVLGAIALRTYFPQRPVGASVVAVISVLGGVVIHAALILNPPVEGAGYALGVLFTGLLSIAAAVVGTVIVAVSGRSAIPA